MTRVLPHVHPGELGPWEDDRARGADLAHDRHGGKVHGACQRVLPTSPESSAPAATGYWGRLWRLRPPPVVEFVVFRWSGKCL